MTRFKTPMRNHFIATAIAPDTSPPGPQCTAPKVLLYSHDTFGLGNIRRTLLLSQALTDEFEKIGRAHV